jgi:hypothetical protein
MCSGHSALAGTGGAWLSHQASPGISDWPRRSLSVEQETGAMAGMSVPRLDLIAAQLGGRLIATRRRRI